MTDEKKPNLHTIPNKEKDKFQASLEAVKRHQDQFLSSLPIITAMRMASYRAHLKAGFTKEQALELCKYLVP